MWEQVVKKAQELSKQRGAQNDLERDSS